MKQILEYLKNPINRSELSNVDNIDDIKLNNVKLIGRDLVDPSYSVRDNPEKLAQVIMDVYHCSSNNVS